MAGSFVREQFHGGGCVVPKRYQIKPVVVEAMQVTDSDCHDEIAKWLGPEARLARAVTDYGIESFDNRDDELWPLDFAYPGDYVTVGLDGEVCIYSEGEFRRMFTEEVVE